jgi:hypothetical protein
MIIEKLLVLTARALLGLFLSSLAGIALYLLSLIAVISVFEVAKVNFAILAVLALGVGAGTGSFIAWMNRELPLRLQALELLLPVAASVAGAWVGLQRGLELDAIKLVGTPGVPALSVATIGAVLAANIPVVALAIVKAIRNPRI